MVTQNGDDRDILLPVVKNVVRDVAPTYEPDDYDDLLADVDIAAQAFDDVNVFTAYLVRLEPQTRENQFYHLKNFCIFLNAADQARNQALLKQGQMPPTPKKQRDAYSLQHDPQAWKGMTYRVLNRYVQWQLQQGSPHSTIHNRISTIHTYTKLAGPLPLGAGVLSEQEVQLIRTIKGYQGKQAINIDAERERQGIPTKIGKKGDPVEITHVQALALKKAKLPLPLASRRPRDLLLAARDELMMCLFIEHALRVSEVTLLKVSSFDLTHNLVTIYRKKTKTTDTQELRTLTLNAARRYLAALRKIGITSGYLFYGYEGKAATTSALRKRVKSLGLLFDIENLTPHALRHFWAFDVLRNKTPLDKAMQAGGWKTLAMLLRYARRQGISNEGVIITEAEDDSM